MITLGFLASEFFLVLATVVDPPVFHGLMRLLGLPAYLLTMLLFNLGSPGLNFMGALAVCVGCDLSRAWLRSKH